MVQNHYGNGYRNGQSNGKRWLLIAALILGAFWLSSSSYHEGFTDGLIQSGQTPAAVRYHGGPHFPWEILIVGGIAYIAWRKGAFDRFGGPGGPFGGGPRDLQQYGPGGGQTPPFGPGQGFGPAFRGPRAFFDDWHRQAHEAERAQYQSAVNASDATGGSPGPFGGGRVRQWRGPACRPARPPIRAGAVSTVTGILDDDQSLVRHDRDERQLRHADQSVAISYQLSAGDRVTGSLAVLPTRRLLSTPTHQ